MLNAVLKLWFKLHLTNTVSITFKVMACPANKFEVIVTGEESFFILRYGRSNKLCVIVKEKEVQMMFHVLNIKLETV